jgi:integrase
MAKLKRRKSGAWGSRITIPKDVRPEYQALYKRHVDELFYAPPECPPQRAQAQYLDWQRLIKNRIATLREQRRGDGIASCSGRDLNQRETYALVGEWYRWFASQHHDNPGTVGHWREQYEGWDCSLFHSVAHDDETREIHMEAPGAREEIYPWLTEAAMTAQFLADRGEVLTPDAMSRFLDRVLFEYPKAVRLLERWAGDYSLDQHLETFPEYRAEVAERSDRSADPRQALSSPQKTNNATAMQLFEGHVLASELAPGTVGRRRDVFITLDAYLAGRSFDTLSDEDAQRWITSLITKTQSASTVQKNWLAPLKAAGRWAVKQHLIKRNPFEDCSVHVPKKTRNRETQAFHDDEIRLILTNANAIKNMRKPAMATKRWVPWICAYTGARAGEITQLRHQDVIERNRIKAIKITPEAGSVKTKEARTVPIHAHLIEQGFLDYVKAKRDGPLFYDPASPAAADGPTDITNPKRSRPVNMRNNLAKWVRSIGVTDPQVSPTHGWRHTFKQIADRHGISDRVSDAITGHAPPTEGRAYGAPTLQDMAEALKRFPRYEIGTAIVSAATKGTDVVPVGPVEGNAFGLADASGSGAATD